MKKYQNAIQHDYESFIHMLKNVSITRNNKYQRKDIEKYK